MNTSPLSSLVWKAGIPLVTAGVFTLALWSVPRLPKPTPAVSAFDLKTLETCLANGTFQERVSCYEPVIHERLAMDGPRKVLAELDRLQEENPTFRSHCHDIAHVLGRAWIARGGTVADGFREGSNVCHSGFFHGMVERIFRSNTALAAEPEHLSSAELQANVGRLCTVENLETNSRNIQFQCLHGLGHAIVFSLGYNLPLVLQTCDVLPEEWDRRSCYGGAFMENITGVEREQRMLRKGDAHYPCSIVASQYRDSCYGMQTSWMLEDGMNWETIIVACRSAGASRLACFQSLGRDVSPRARREGPGEFVSICANLAADERSACIRGAVYALADHTWDGRYAYPFCAAFPEQALQTECFERAHQHLLGSLEQPVERIAPGCARLTEGKDTCETTLNRAIAS